MLKTVEEIQDALEKAQAGGFCHIVGSAFYVAYKILWSAEKMYAYNIQGANITDSHVLALNSSLDVDLKRSGIVLECSASPLGPVYQLYVGNNHLIMEV